MDGLPFDLTERQVYKIGKQITSALVSLINNPFIPLLSYQSSLNFDAFYYPCNTIALAHKSKMIN